MSKFIVKQENQLRGVYFIQNEPELREIFITKQDKLTEIYISNCPRLRKCTLIFSKRLTDVVIHDCEQLESVHSLFCNINNFQMNPDDLKRLTHLRLDGHENLERLKAINPIAEITSQWCKKSAPPPDALEKLRAHRIRRENRAHAEETPFTLPSKTEATELTPLPVAPPKTKDLSKFQTFMSFIFTVYMLTQIYKFIFNK
jgi:hypothetical protein